MELKDTIEMMNSADYKERFEAEYAQLNVRMAKLNDFLAKYQAGELTFTPSCSYELLGMQLTAMVSYATALEFRADIEGIDLSKYNTIL